jgi:hypothetical protein
MTVARDKKKGFESLSLKCKRLVKDQKKYGVPQLEEIVEYPREKPLVVPDGQPFGSLFLID